MLIMVQMGRGQPQNIKCVKACTIYSRGKYLDWKDICAWYDTKEYEWDVW